MRYKPTKEQFSEWLESGGSLRGLSKECGYSVKYLADLCETYELKKPKVGRPKGYRMSEKSRKKTSDTIKKIHEGNK